MNEIKKRTSDDLIGATYFQVEPKEVESGEGLLPKLPPIEDTFGLGAVPVAEALRQRSDQLQASLLREKGLREEVERLKGLLRDGGINESL